MPTQDVFWPATRNDIHWAVWSGAALIALITLGRAAVDAVSPWHPAWLLLMVAGVLAGNLTTWWWSLPHPAPGLDRAQVARGGVAVCPSLILGVVLAGASNAALIGVLAVAACGFAFVVVHVQQRGIAPTHSQFAPSGPEIESPRSEVMESAAPNDGFDDPLVQQQITRRRTESGAECLEALLRIEFAANQREASIHLPIQPAFAGPPEVECEPLDEADVSLKVASVHPYGVRIDVKRSGGELDAATIAVGVLMHSATAAEAAA